MNKTVIKGYTLEELKEYFSSLGEPKYRAGQLFNWIYNHLSVDFNEMLNMPKTLRQKLDETSVLKTLSLVDSVVSSSGTKKYVFETLDGNKIESVFIPEEKRNTLCISTQVGCPLDCQFCATGLMGFKKNLSTGEIFDQYMLACKDLGKENITNIVYMGMGEPLLNYTNTINSLKIFADELTTGISLKRITLSTSGITPKIYELAQTGLKAKLALSLHSCFEETRSKIMPINKKYNLKDLLQAVKQYAEHTDTRITFEYIMLKDINDRDEDIKALTKLCSSVPSKINIIPFNSLEHMNPAGFAAELKPSSKKRIESFAQKLRDKNITVLVRFTQGQDIAAACGQLAVKY